MHFPRNGERRLAELHLRETELHREEAELHRVISPQEKQKRGPGGPLWLYPLQRRRGSLGYRLNLALNDQIRRRLTGIISNHRNALGITP